MRALHAPILALLFLLACSPALNWREVRLGGGAGGELNALLPCKPDQATRPQSLAGYNVTLTMLGCEAQGGLFTVSVAELGTPLAAKTVMAQWQLNLLAALQAQGASRKPFSIAGADASPEATALQVSGRGKEGRPVTVQAVWFARGARLYHAALHAERPSEEMSEPFFSSLKLQ